MNAGVSTMPWASCKVPRRARQSVVCKVKFMFPCRSDSARHCFSGGQNLPHLAVFSHPLKETQLPKNYPLSLEKKSVGRFLPDMIFGGGQSPPYITVLPLDQHRIAIAEKTILLFHRMAVGGEHFIHPSKRAHQHQQCRARQVKIGEQHIHHFEAITRYDEDVG